MEESAFGGGEMETSNLSWIDSSDDTGDERSILPALIVVLISAAIGGHFLFRIYREDEI